MVLLDSGRRQVDVNSAYLQLLGYSRDAVVGQPAWRFVAGGPLVTEEEWRGILDSPPFTGETGLVASDGTVVAVQWAITPEVVTGDHLVLFVALKTSRWGRHFRRAVEVEGEPGDLTPREREIVHLVALGFTGPEIAEELHLAHDTVRTHVRNAMAKTGSRSRAHLVARALAEGHVFED